MEAESHRPGKANLRSWSRKGEKRRGLYQEACWMSWKKWSAFFKKKKKAKSAKHCGKNGGKTQPKEQGENFGKLARRERKGRGKGSCATDLPSPHQRKRKEIPCRLRRSGTRKTGVSAWAATRNGGKKEGFNLPSCLREEPPPTKVAQEKNAPECQY